jgi:hypothetical protein
MSISGGMQVKRNTKLRVTSGLFAAALFAAVGLAEDFTAGAASPTAMVAHKVSFLAPAAAKPDAHMVTLFNRQKVLDKIAGRITEGLSETARAKIPGFSEIVVNPDTNHLRLYWKGTPPQRVKSILADLPKGVTADVLPARHSKAELNAARAKLISGGKMVDLHVTPSGAALRITSIALATDGSGLVIGYDEDLGVGKRSLVDPLGASARQGRSNSVQALTTGLTGVSTQAVYQPLSKDLSRRNDFSPWFGASAIKSSTASICSSGFAVKYQGSYALTIAYHCVGSGSSSWSTFDGTYIGNSGVPTTSSGTAIGVDTDLLFPSSGVTGGYLFDGLPDLTTSYAKPVTGWGHNNKGDYLCTDGANSGIHCNVKITELDTSVVGANGALRPDVDLAMQQSTSDIAAQDGDSGGPVFAGVNNWTGDEARGTITANHATTTCPSSEQTHTLFKDKKLCYNGTYFVPIYQTLSLEGLTLVTG